MFRLKYKKKYSKYFILIVIIIVTQLRALAFAPISSPIFSKESGFYKDSVILKFVWDKTAIVYFTLDGSIPTRRSYQYKRPIKLLRTTVVRAVVVKKNLRSSIVGHTFFINEPQSNIPVVSLATHPSLLFHPKFGLYVKGFIAKSLLNKNANFWSRREIPIHFEYFDSSGKNVLNTSCGLRIFGGNSRIFPQKSLAVIARKRYGKKRFKYGFFGEKGLDKFKYLVLRNSGSDWGMSHFRDALVAKLVKNWDIETQNYQPAHIFINGSYWGIYNLREKTNSHYIESHFDIDKDSIDLIEHRLTLRKGSTRKYTRLLNYLQLNNLAVDSCFKFVASQMDVDNFMRHQIAQIYCDNQDAGGNIRFWRAKKPDAKWRWILFDTDYGFGLYDANAYQHNSLSFHTEPNGPDWPNPSWSTFLLRKLLENKQFKDRFIVCFLDYLNTDFHPKKVNSTIDSIYSVLKDEMPRHFDRWNLSSKTWENQINIIRNFANNRPQYMRAHLGSYFGLQDQKNIIIKNSEGGVVRLNDNINVPNDSINGIYFSHQQITIEALANFGFHFLRWEGINDPVRRTNPRITLNTNDINQALVPVFSRFTHPLTDKIIINEICNFNPNSGDWLEIMNTSRKEINMNGWMVSDGIHQSKITTNCIIKPDSFAIVSNNKEKFKTHFPFIPNANLIPCSFGFNKLKESIMLIAPDRGIVDSIDYNMAAMEQLSTFSLKTPFLNNIYAENWERVIGEGTPGKINTFYKNSLIEASQKRWTMAGIVIGITIVISLFVYFQKK